jgi:hypothetical protein
MALGGLVTGRGDLSHTNPGLAGRPDGKPVPVPTAPPCSLELVAVENGSPFSSCLSSVARLRNPRPPASASAGGSRANVASNMLASAREEVARLVCVTSGQSRISKQLFNILGACVRARISSVGAHASTAAAVSQSPGQGGDLGIAHQAGYALSVLGSLPGSVVNIPRLNCAAGLGSRKRGTLSARGISTGRDRRQVVMRPTGWTY